MCSIYFPSLCSPSIPAILVRIPLKPTVISVQFVIEKNPKINKKRPGLAHFYKIGTGIKNQCLTDEMALGQSSSVSKVTEPTSTKIAFFRFQFNLKRRVRVIFA